MAQESVIMSVLGTQYPDRVDYDPPAGSPPATHPKFSNIGVRDVLMLDVLGGGIAKIKRATITTIDPGGGSENSFVTEGASPGGDFEQALETFIAGTPPWDAYLKTVRVNTEASTAIVLAVKDASTTPVAAYYLIREVSEVLTAVEISNVSPGVL